MNLISKWIAAVVLGTLAILAYTNQPNSEPSFGATVIARSQGGTASASYDPNDDRIFYWNDAAGTFKWLDIGTNLSITSNTLNATGGAGGTNSNIPFLTVGNTASLSYERALAVFSPLTFTDGGVNSTATIGLSSNSINFDELVGLMVLDSNSSISLSSYNLEFSGVNDNLQFSNDSNANAYVNNKFINNLGHIGYIGAGGSGLESLYANKMYIEAGTYTGISLIGDASVSGNFEVPGTASISNIFYLDNSTVAFGKAGTSETYIDGNNVYIGFNAPVSSLTIDATKTSFGGTASISGNVEISGTATKSFIINSDTALKGACLVLEDVGGGGTTYCRAKAGSLICNTTSCR